MCRNIQMQAWFRDSWETISECNEYNKMRCRFSVWMESCCWGASGWEQNKKASKAG